MCSKWRIEVEKKAVTETGGLCEERLGEEWRTKGMGEWRRVVDTAVKREQ